MNSGNRTSGDLALVGSTTAGKQRYHCYTNTIYQFSSRHNSKTSPGMSESKSASDDDLVLKELLQQAPRKQSSLGNTNLTWGKKYICFKRKIIMIKN